MRLASLLLVLLVSSAVWAQGAPFVLADADTPSQSTAALFTDANGDGFIDLIYGDAFDRNRVFLGDGTGAFRKGRAGTTGQPFTDGVFADLDNDGDQDIAIGSLNRSGLVINTNGRYQAVDSALDLYNDARSVDVADVNGDGLLDVFLSRRFNDPNILLIADGNGDYTRQPGAHETATTSNGSCWTDADNDGDPDVFVTNGSGGADEFYLNEGGTLVPAGQGPALDPDTASTVCTWGDADGDGDFDLFVGRANGQPSQLFLWKNGRLSPASIRAFEPPVLESFGAVWGDIDNDGDLDLIVANRDQSARLYRNDRNRATEVEILPEITNSSFMVAAALADVDRDGDLDLALPAGNSNFDQPSLLLENTSEGGNWLQVRLIGTDSNRDAIGARLEATATIGGETRVLLREKRAHASRRSQGGPWVHFGLGDATEVASLTIRWPSGTVQTVGPLAANGFVEIVEDAGTTAAKGGAVNTLATVFGLSVSPNPARDDVRVQVDVPEGGAVTVEAYDALGRRVWHEIHSTRPGERLDLTWIPATDLASGSYIARAQGGRFNATRQVTLVR